MLWHQSFFVGGVILKKIKYFFPFLFLFIFIFSLSVNAEDNTIVCQEYSVGDELVFFYESYYFAGQDGVNNGTKIRVDFRHIVDSEEPKLCIYVENNYLRWFGLDAIEYEFHNYMWSPDNPQWIDTNSGYVYDYHPAPYGNNQCVTIDFHTNIPIFSSKSDAEQYLSGNLDLKSAINYKKTMENNEWVKPFEDIDINDREIPVPELCNITHSSFSVSNNVDEKYLVEVYLDSGLQNPYYALNAMTYNSIDDPFYVNSFGLITDRSEAYWNGPDFDVFALWQVDNRSALLESVNSFYTRFPTALSWYTAEDVQTTGVFSNFDKTAYGIWGAPFGDKYGLWGNISKVTAEDLAAVDIDDVPLCFTHYRVRYWYYDDDSGYHYGPWASVVYFSDGKVVINSIFQDDDGNIIESGTESGRQDGNGILNITDKFGSLDLGSSDNLFAYVNSLFTNLKYVAGNFSIVFASVFSFLPEDVRHMIYLGMGAIIVIAIIKALRG